MCGLLLESLVPWLMHSQFKSSASCELPPAPEGVRIG